jgi:hypothetical protein
MAADNPLQRMRVRTPWLWPNEHALLESIPDFKVAPVGIVLREDWLIAVL